MPNYRRCFIPGGSYFFTVAIEDRHDDLLLRNIAALRQSVARVKQLHPFEIDGWVVLPEHLHCIWTLPPDDSDYPSRWRLIKLLFSKQLPAGERLTPTKRLRHERGLWQRRYWEHCLRDDADFAAHMDYLHFNPVKHGWVSRVCDWPYSSFHRLVAAGIYAADWGGGCWEQAKTVGE